MQTNSHSHTAATTNPKTGNFGNLSRRKEVRFALFPGDPFSYSALLTSTLEYGVWSVCGLIVKRFKTGVGARIPTGYLLKDRLLSTGTRPSF
jgi:hypothetical protein